VSTGDFDEIDVDLHTAGSRAFDLHDIVLDREQYLVEVHRATACREWESYRWQAPRTPSSELTGQAQRRDESALAQLHLAILHAPDTELAHSEGRPGLRADHNPDRRPATTLRLQLTDAKEKRKVSGCRRPYAWRLQARGTGLNQSRPAVQELNGDSAAAGRHPQPLAGCP
jgi:hypothetical protein